MKLIPELLALNEEKGQVFQLKHGNYKWDDVKLDIRDLQTLHKEIAMNPSSGEADTHKWNDLAVLHNYILNYHGITGDKKVDQNKGFFDAIDPDYEVMSFDDDVLKIKYRFTIRFTNDKPAQEVENTVTLMPGN